MEQKRVREVVRGNMREETDANRSIVCVYLLFALSIVQILGLRVNKMGLLRLVGSFFSCEREVGLPMKMELPMLINCSQALAVWRLSSVVQWSPGPTSGDTSRVL